MTSLIRRVFVYSGHKIEGPCTILFQEKKKEQEMPGRRINLPQVKLYMKLRAREEIIPFGPAGSLMHFVAVLCASGCE